MFKKPKPTKSNQNDDGASQQMNSDFVMQAAMEVLEEEDHDPSLDTSPFSH